MKPSNDQVLVCPICGRQLVVDFAVAIASGWPRCCEVSMLLAGALQMDEQKVESVSLGCQTLRVGLFTEFFVGVLSQMRDDARAHLARLEASVEEARQRVEYFEALIEGLEDEDADEAE
jgi:hypothetical protein